jgi:hypothetical protein
MNIAIGISTLLLGGWVLNTPVQELSPEQAALTPTMEELFPLQPAVPAEQPKAEPPRRDPNPLKGKLKSDVEEELRKTKEAQLRGTMDASGKKIPTVNGKPIQQGNMPKLSPWALPPSPTDPLRANALGGVQYPLPPTVRQEDLMPGEGPVDPFSSPTTPKPLDIPPSRQAYVPRTAQAPSMYDETQQTRDRVDAALHPAYAPQQAPPKAFADARPFSSGVSPYMNLFRNDTNGGTIDNYSTYVRPALDQRSMNQQFNVDLYGLQRNQRIQNAALEQLGRTYSRAPQAIGTPQFYGNYGNYYPGSYGPSNIGQGPYGAAP